MRTPVICNNCNIKWVRVVCTGSSIEWNENLQYNCPNCNSNWYEEIKSNTFLEKLKYIINNGKRIGKSVMFFVNVDSNKSKEQDKAKKKSGTSK